LEENPRKYFVCIITDGKLQSRSDEPIFVAVKKSSVMHTVKATQVDPRWILIPLKAAENKPDAIVVSLPLNQP
jgi:hypothetical protein